MRKGSGIGTLSFLPINTVRKILVMGVLKKITDEYFKKGIRSEDGIAVTLDGKNYSILFNDYDFLTNLIPSVKTGELFTEITNPYEGRKAYACKWKYDDDFFAFYMADTEKLRCVKDGTFDDETLEFLCFAKYDAIDDNFIALRVLQESDIFYTGYQMESATIKKGDDVPYTVVGNDAEIEIYTDYDKVKKKACDKFLATLEAGNKKSMNGSEFRFYFKFYGDSWIHTDKIESFLEERGDSFDSLDVLNEYVRMHCRKRNSKVPSKFYDLGKLSRAVIEKDGPTYEISHGNGKEYRCKIDGQEYYAYVVE